MHHDLGVGVLGAAAGQANTWHNVQIQRVHGQTLRCGVCRRGLDRHDEFVAVVVLVVRIDPIKLRLIGMAGHRAIAQRGHVSDIAGDLIA